MGARKVRLHGGWWRALKARGFSHAEAVSVARLANGQRLGSKDSAKVVLIGLANRHKWRKP